MARVGGRAEPEDAALRETVRGGSHPLNMDGKAINYLRHNSLLHNTPYAGSRLSLIGLGRPEALFSSPRLLFLAT